MGSRLDVSVVRPEVTDADERLAGELATDPEVASHVRAIDELIEAHDSVLVFVNTRQTAEALGSRFKKLGTDLGVHHGSLAKETRIDVEDRFKNGELDALLCTSSMELGIDVGHVDHVIQYGSPRQVARLLQRVGRAGHRRDLVSSGWRRWRSPARPWTARSNRPKSTTAASIPSQTRSPGSSWTSARSGRWRPTRSSRAPTPSGT